MERPIGQANEWEWIDRYWSGQLPPEEKAFFEQTMQLDPRFAQEAATLREGIVMMETIHLERHIRQTLRQLREADRRPLQIRVRCLQVGGGVLAACLALLLLLFARPIQLPGYENDWEVIRALSNDYPARPVDPRQQAFDQFFDAQALFSEGRLIAAAQRFEQVLRYPNLRPYFREAVQWHLVMCYLKTDQPVKAEAVYKQVKDKKAYDINPLDRWQIGCRVWLSGRL